MSIGKIGLVAFFVLFFIVSLYKWVSEKKFVWKVFLYGVSMAPVVVHFVNYGFFKTIFAFVLIFAIVKLLLALIVTGKQIGRAHV